MKKEISPLRLTYTTLRRAYRIASRDFSAGGTVSISREIVSAMRHLTGKWDVGIWGFGGYFGKTLRETLYFPLPSFVRWMRKN